MQSRIYNNGGYIHIDSPLVEGWHKCEDKEFFAHQLEYTGQLDDKMLQWKGAKVPKEILLEVAAVAKQRPNREIMVCLYYNKTEGKWLANVPEQTGGAAKVEYDDEAFDPPAGYQFLGAIHTHPQMGAFWSETDMRDMKLKPGVHMVLGLHDGTVKEVLCSLFHNGARYDQEAYEVPDSWEALPEPNADWLALTEDRAPKEETATYVETPEALSWEPHYYHSDSDFPTWYDVGPQADDRINALLKIQEINDTVLQDPDIGSVVDNLLLEEAFWEEMKGE